MAALLTFDSFEPDALLGSFSDLADDRTVRLWGRLYPWDAAVTDQPLPAGLATVLSMRAYMHIVSPRPPGNIHAGMSIDLIAPVMLNAPVSTEISCLGKELRRGHRFVKLISRSSDQGGRPLFAARMSMIWAA